MADSTKPTSIAHAFTLGDITVRQLDGLFSLNDLHKASGAEEKHQPSFFLRNDQIKALIEEIQSANSQTAVNSINGGKSRGTYACRELVIAYAAWINAAFHLKVIRVFLAATQPQAGPAIAYDRISPAQAQDLKEIVAAIVQAGIQGYGETWARLQRKFKVNSYLELPATQHLEARAYLLAKLPAAVPPRARRMVELPPGKTIVDIRKLAAIWHDLGRLHQRLDGLGVLESDLPPAWWESKAISPDQGSIFS